MRGDTDNRVENYIKRHENYKRWLAFVLSLSLFTGTVTLYMLNKPATAMTEDGAGQIGLVMETADSEFEQGLIEQMENGETDEVNELQDPSVEENETVIDDVEKTEEPGSNDPENVEESNASKSASSDDTEDSSKSSSTEEVTESEESSSASSASTQEESASDASSLASSKESASDASSEASSEIEEDEEDLVKDTVITVLYTDLNGEEIAESKELAIEESYDVSEDVRELDGYIFYKAYIKDNQIVKLVKKTEKKAIAFDNKENVDSVASYISEDEKSEKVVEYTYYEATTIGGEVFEVKEDTDLRLVYFEVNTKDEFVYNSGEVTVTVKLTSPESIPAGSELSVKTVDAQTEGYNYEAYMEALNLNAEAIAKASKSDEEKNEEIATEKVVYDDTNTFLFDVAFMFDGVEYEPKNGSVSVSVKFHNKQISEGLEATEEDDLTVVHLPLIEEVMEEVNSTSEATEITADDIELEIYKEGNVSLEDNADVISFETDSFSITAVVKSTLNNTAHTWDGTNVKSATEIIEGLGNAKYFGAVADEISGNSHFETNVAVNNYAEGAGEVLFDYEHTNGGYISSDEYKSYSIIVKKKSSELGTFYFALYKDEAATQKVAGSEFSFKESDFTLSDGYYVASHRIEGFTEKNPNVYVYELDKQDGQPVLNGNDYDNFTVTYQSELNETSNAVDALMSSYITNGNYNESQLSGMLHRNSTVYFDATSNGWKKGTKDANSHVAISDQLYDIPTDFVDTIIGDAENVSSLLPYIASSDSVDTFNVIASKYGNYMSDFYNAGKDKYGWTDQNNITDKTKGITFGDNKLLIINLDLTGRDNYSIGQYSVNGQLTGEIYDHFGSVASRIIINPVQKNSAGEYEPYTGNLRLENVAGTVLAPSADIVSVGVAGSVIAKDLRLDGEIHKVTLIGYLKIGGTVEITNTSIKNELELQLYKFVNGSDPQNATFNFTIKRLKDEMDGWSNGKYDKTTTDHTALTNVGNSINYKFDPAYWSMTPGNTYIFRITEDALSSNSAYTIDKSQIYVKVVYKGANNADITYYRLGKEEENFDWWVEELNKAVTGDTKNSEFIKNALVNGICNDDSRKVVGTKVSFNNSTVKGKLEVFLNKYLNDELCPSDEHFTFKVRVLNAAGKYLKTLYDELPNDGGKISFSFDYNDEYIYENSVYFIVTENDIPEKSSVTYEKDDDYIVIRVSGLDKNAPQYGYFKFDPTDDKNLIDRLEKRVVLSDYNKHIWSLTKKAEKGVRAEEAGFYNTSSSYLRIHKIVVNDFGSDFVRDNTGTALLKNVKFRITNNATGNYIVFQGFVDDSEIEGRAIEYYGDTHKATGNTYTVYYNSNAQWTIQGIPTGTYSVEEVADGLTFEFAHDNNSSASESTVLETTNLSRVTMYDVTEDVDGSAFGGFGGQNWRKVFSKDLDISFESYKAPKEVVVGGNIQTVHVCNFYSIPIGPIQVTKNLVGGEWKNMEFTFEMEAVSYAAKDSEGNPVSLKYQPMPGGSTEKSVLVTISDTTVDSDGNKLVKQNADGTYSAVVRFDSIPFRYEGEYIYKITEKKSDAEGIKYDESAYYVKIQVEKKYTTFNRPYSYKNNKHSIYVQNGDYSDHLEAEDFYYLGANVTYSDDEYFNNVLTTCELYLGSNPDTNNPDNNAFIVKYSDDEGVKKVAFTNSLTGRLTVIKKWLDKDGNDDGKNHSALNIYIWQRLQGSNDGWTVYDAKTITPSADGKWEYTVKDLPLTDEHGNKYEYTVKESDEYLATHLVSYEYGGTYNAADQREITVGGKTCKDTGYSMTVVNKDGQYDYGTVTITNATLFRNELPSTGSTGTVPFAAMGAALMIIASCGMFLLQKKKRNII